MFGDRDRGYVDANEGREPYDLGAYTVLIARTLASKHPTFALV